MSAVQPYMPGFEGEQRRADLSQWYTPPDTAERFWGWVRRGDRFPQMPSILEPSAGRGALITPIASQYVYVRCVVAYDTDPINAAHLAKTFGLLGLSGEVRSRDFLADPEPGHFDLCVMNPPFEGNQDIAFASRALDVCPIVCGIFAARILHSAGRAEFWRWTDIRRQVVLCERPQFGGDFTPMTDFVLLELERRPVARKQGEACATQMEWWS